LCVRSIEEGARIDWTKTFSFLLDPKVMAQVNKLPENSRRREIPPLGIWSAGNQGRFSNSMIDEIVLEFMIREEKKGL